MNGGIDEEISKAEIAFFQRFRIMRQRASDLLGADPACNGKVTGTTLDLLGEIAALGGLSPMQAMALGRMQERQDTVAFLEGRRRAAEAIRAKNPENGDASDTHFKAKWSAEQISVEIESITQGLHECMAVPIGMNRDTNAPQDSRAMATVEAARGDGPEAIPAASDGSAAVAGTSEPVA